MAEHIALAFALLAIAGLVWRWPRDREDGGQALPTPVSSPPGPDEAAILEALCQDIRARASGMVGLAELLVAAPLDEDQQQQAALIADSGRTMIRLLGDVLDVTRIDAGGLQLQAEPTDLREVLGHNVNLMQASAVARGLMLALMVDDAVPARVLIDRDRLRQVLLNLVGNAIKFTRRGTIDVQARVAQTPGGPQLAISVIDPGIGIDRARQADVFEPFFRQEPGPAARTRSTTGTGLGLALSVRIVQAMGGDITLESAKGLGSCFTIRFPLEEAVTDPGLADTPAPGRARNLLTPNVARLCDLEARYFRRKEALFATLHSTLAMPVHRAAEADWTTITNQLHRVAGVAANFGDEHLGDLARQLHAELGDQSSARQRHAVLAGKWVAFQALR